MSDFKMKMRLSTNQSSQQTQNTPNQAVQQSIIRSLQNQNSFIKLGNSGISRKGIVLTPIRIQKTRQINSAMNVFWKERMIRVRYRWVLGIMDEDDARNKIIQVRNIPMAYIPILGVRTMSGPP